MFAINQDPVGDMLFLLLARARVDATSRVLCREGRVRSQLGRMEVIESRLAACDFGDKTFPNIVADRPALMQEHALAAPCMPRLSRKASSRIVCWSLRNFPAILRPKSQKDNCGNGVCLYFLLMSATHDLGSIAKPDVNGQRCEMGLKLVACDRVAL